MRCGDDGPSHPADGRVPDKAGRSLSLDIVGGGPFRKALVWQASSLRLEERIRSRGFRTDVRHFLPGCRVYVNASYSESSSLAIIEAMAAGLPIVAGNPGSSSELCDEGLEARFWPLDDPASAAAILMDLLDREPARLKAARERFHRDFDADVAAANCGPSCWGRRPGRSRL